MATQIKRLKQNGQEFVPITIAEAVVVNTGQAGSQDQITTLDVVLRQVLGNDANLSTTLENINKALEEQASNITATQGAIGNLQNTKQDKLTFNSTQFEIDENNNVSLIQTFKLFQVVEVLPTSNINSNIIYLVPYADPEESPANVGNYLKEYVYLSDTQEWEEFGQIQIPEEVDLSGYITRTEYTNKIGSLESAISTNTESISGIQTRLQIVEGTMITADDVTGSDNSTIVKVSYDIPSTLYDSALGIDTDYIIKG